MTLSKEFILDPDKALILVVQPFGQSYEKLLVRLKQEAQYQVVECPTTMDAAALARQARSALILGYFQAPEQVPSYLNLLKILQDFVSRGSVKVIITTKVALDQPTDDRLKIMGCGELIREPATERGLMFKVDRVAKQLFPGSAKAAEAAVTARATSEKEKKKERKQVEPGPESGGRGQAAVSGKPANRAYKMVIVPVLTLKSDCWIVRDGGARLVGGRWTIKLHGPGPAAGKWVEVEDQKPGDPVIDPEYEAKRKKYGSKAAQEKPPESFYDSHCFRWVPTPGSIPEPFAGTDGSWIFRGLRPPEFYEDQWWFSGKKPLLAYYVGMEFSGAKFELNLEGDISMAGDSARALGLLSRMEPTWHDSLELQDKTDDDTSRAARGDGEDAGSGGTTEAESPSAREKQVRRTPPLALESDCWLFPRQGAKRIGDRWSVKMLGPGPLAGHWEESRGDGSRDDESEGVWKWVPEDPKNDPFIPEMGEWVFRGQCPRFEEANWLFVGRRPELAFYYQNENYGAKLMPSPDGYGLDITQESDAARAKLRDIRNSLVRYVREMAEVKPDEEYVIREEVRESKLLEAEKGEIESLDIQDKRGEDIGRDEGLNDLRTDDETFEYELTHFGDEGGQWEYVCSGGEGAKWYAFVPLVILNGVTRNVRELGIYWTYLGPHRPGAGPSELDPAKTVWKFARARPSSTDAFDELIEALQRFFDARVEASQAEAEKEDRVFQEDRFSEMIRKRLTQAGVPLPENALDAFDRTNRPFTPPPENRGINQMSGPDAVRAPKPPGPTLQPLALAFLASELARGRDGTLESRVNKFCEYLSACCGSLRVEFWCASGEGWKKIGESQGPPPPGGETELDQTLDSERIVSLATPDGIRPTRRWLAASSSEGAVVVIHGYGTELIETVYATSAVKFARGFTLALKDAA